MNREEVIALAQKFDMRKGRRPRVSSAPRAAATTTTTALRVAAVTGNNALHRNNSIPAQNNNINGNGNTNKAVLASRSEVEAAARLYDERLARASAYARKRRRDGKSSTGGNKHQYAPSTSPTNTRTYGSRAKKKQAQKAPKVPAPIVTSFPSAKIQPNTPVNPPNSRIAPAVSAPVPVAEAGNNHRTVSAIAVPAPSPASLPPPVSSPPPQAYSSTNVPETNINITSADTYTSTQPQDSVHVNHGNPHHVITAASTAPLSTPNHEAQPPNAPMNLVSSYTNTHQTQVMELPAYPTFPEQPSPAFDAPIYGPHLQAEQYATANAQPGPQQPPTTDIHYAQTTQQGQDAIEFVEPQHPSGEVDTFNPEQQPQEIVSYEQQVIDNPQPNAFGESTVEYGREVGVEEQNVVVHGDVNSFGQNSTFVGENTFGESANVVFEGPENVVYSEGHNDAVNTDGAFGAGDPVSVEQTAQANGVNGNGLVQEGAPEDGNNDNTCYDAAGGPQLFHEYPVGFDDEGDGEYAHLIPPPPEPEEGVDWNNGTGTDTASAHGFEEDTLGELDVPAKKRRFNGMQQIFGQDGNNNSSNKRSKIFENNE